MSRSSLPEHHTGTAARSSMTSGTSPIQAHGAADVTPQSPKRANERARSQAVAASMIVTAVWTFELAKLYSPTKGAPTAASTITTTSPRRSPGDRNVASHFQILLGLVSPFVTRALAERSDDDQNYPLALVLVAVI